MVKVKYVKNNMYDMKMGTVSGYVWSIVFGKEVSRREIFLTSPLRQNDNEGLEKLAKEYKVQKR